MKYFTHCFLFCFIQYTTSDFVAISRKPLFSHCEGNEKNVIIERFFNVIFAEFQSTPPVCVCVQMCMGQSTYCYPNACLQRGDLRRVDSPQIPNPKSDRKQFMFVIDEKPEVGADYLESHQVDDTKVATSSIKPLLPYNPEYFKENNFKKYRKHLPQVELRYNIREQVKNMKIENTDLSKTRWPKNNHYNHKMLGGHRMLPNAEKVPPVVGRSKFFMSMLTDNNVADYPPKYFKRDVKKDDYETNLKEVYIYDTADNMTDFASFSLETLIDNLIKINYETNLDMTNTSKPKMNNENIITNNVNEFTVIPLNLTVLPKTTNISKNPNQDLDNNKYTEQNDSINVISGMILNLEKRIEKQNNTSLEMAKRIVTDIDMETDITTEEIVTQDDKNEKNDVLNQINESTNKSDSVRSVNTDVHIQSVSTEYEIEPTTVTEIVETPVTTKVKRRVPRKLGTKNMN